MAYIISDSLGRFCGMPLAAEIVYVVGAKAKIKIEREKIFGNFYAWCGQRWENCALATVLQSVHLA